MLVDLREILKMAEAGNYAVGSFNTPNLECIEAVIGTAEKMNVPVILMHAQVHEPVAPIDVIGPVMVLMAKRAKVPVCALLDHGETLDYVEKALDLGFTGIMYDGSLQPYDVNVKNTIRAVEMAHKLGAGVEAEIGQLAAREGGDSKNAAGPVYTDPELAVKFVKETGIDALAPSFGTAHGIYKSKPVLDLDRVARIKELTGLPLVMHGGSGVSPEDYKIAIRNGIRKINYYSYMSKAGTTAARNYLNEKDVTFYHDIALAAKNAMAEDVEKAMHIFYNI